MSPAEELLVQLLTSSDVSVRVETASADGAPARLHLSGVVALTDQQAEDLPTVIDALRLL